MYADERIVTDLAVESRSAPTVKCITPTSPGKAAGPLSPGESYDSGFLSGPVQAAAAAHETHKEGSAAGVKPKVPYHRLDSGIIRDMQQMSLTPEPPDSPLVSPTALQVSPVSPGIVISEHVTELEKAQQQQQEYYEPDQDGDTQLHLAIASGFVEVVFALVRMAPHPAYLDIQNNEMYAPLHIAVLMNQAGMVRRLVVAGATIDIRDQEGNTPLHLAAKRGYLECAQALLSIINVKEMKEAGVDHAPQQNPQSVIDQKNYHGEHCVHLATFGHHYSFLQFLCWNGADMSAVEGRSGKTALHYAVNTRDQQLVGLLANHRGQKGCQVNLNVRDWAGRTALQCATINGDMTIVQLLSSLPGCDTSMDDSDFEDTDEELAEVPRDGYTDIEVNGVRVVESMA